MAYDKQKIYKQALKAVIEHNLYFIEDIIAFLPCAKPTFYDFFPLESDEMNTIKSELDKNKTNAKINLRSKFFRSENSTERIALYKLIGTDEERRKLSTNYNEISGDENNPLKIIWNEQKTYETEQKTDHSS